MAQREEGSRRHRLPPLPASCVPARFPPPRRATERRSHGRRDVASPRVPRPGHLPVCTEPAPAVCLVLRALARGGCPGKSLSGLGREGQFAYCTVLSLLRRDGQGSLRPWGCDVHSLAVRHPRSHSHRTWCVRTSCPWAGGHPGRALPGSLWWNRPSHRGCSRLLRDALRPALYLRLGHCQHPAPAFAGLLAVFQLPEVSRSRLPLGRRWLRVASSDRSRAYAVWAQRPPVCSPLRPSHRGVGLHRCGDHGGARHTPPPGCSRGNHGCRRRPSVLRRLGQPRRDPTTAGYLASGGGGIVPGSGGGLLGPPFAGPLGEVSLFLAGFDAPISAGPSRAMDCRYAA